MTLEGFVQGLHALARAFQVFLVVRNGEGGCVVPIAQVVEFIAGPGPGRLGLSRRGLAPSDLGVEVPYLLIVDSANPASIRVVEANGGRLDDDRLHDAGNPYRRYWTD